MDGVLKGIHSLTKRPSECSLRFRSAPIPDYALVGERASERVTFSGVFLSSPARALVGPVLPTAFPFAVFNFPAT